MSAAAPSTVTTQDVERTGRITTVAQWGVACVVMGGSMAAGGFAFHYLHENAALGVVTALAVDLALAAWLLISRRLRDLGITSWLGVVLEFAAGGMTLFLNMGAAAFRDGVSASASRVLLAVAHSFLPVMLVLVTLAGGDAQLQLLRVRREREAAEQAHRDAQEAARRAEQQAEQARLRREQAEREERLRAEQEEARTRRDEDDLRRAQGELVDAQDYLTKAAELRQQAEREKATAAELRAHTEAEVAATRTAAAQLAKLHRKQTEPSTPGRGRQPASREQRRQWVREQRAAGRNPSGAEVDKRFGPPRTGAAIVAEVDAELRRGGLHAVGGGGH